MAAATEGNQGRRMRQILHYPLYLMQLYSSVRHCTERELHSTDTGRTAILVAPSHHAQGTPRRTRAALKS